MHPLNAKCKVQTPRPYVILSERQRDEVLGVQQSVTDKTKRLGAPGSKKKSALTLQLKEIFSYYLGFREKEK